MIHIRGTPTTGSELAPNELQQVTTLDHHMAPSRDGEYLYSQVSTGRTLYRIATRRLTDPCVSAKVISARSKRTISRHHTDRQSTTLITDRRPLKHQTSDWQGGTHGTEKVVLSPH